MRTLRFIVEGQIVRRDSECNFDDIIMGTERYLKAEFSFSPEWRNFVKVAGFLTSGREECPPQLLKDGKTCIIPTEALKSPAFSIFIVGKNKMKQKLTTNQVTVNQDWR